MSISNIGRFFRFYKVKVVGSKLIEEDKVILIYLEPDKRFSPKCSGCGYTRCWIHSYETRYIRDLPLAATKVILRYTYRKLRCPFCVGTRVEAHDFVAPYARVTKRFAEYIFSLCHHMTIKVIAQHLGLNWKTVKEIDKAGIREQLDCTEERIAPILAIDEISIRKGHRYMTVVIDHEKGTILWMGQDRNEDTLNRFFLSLTKEERASIRGIAIDMWDPYIKAIKTYCPTTAIVFDLFHVVSQFSRVIDTIRNQEYINASQSEQPVIKGTKYLLLKNRLSLKPEEKPRLKLLLTLNQNISTAYILKDYLKKLWQYRYPKRAQNFLDYWCHLADQSGLIPLKKFARMLKRHAYGILNHCSFPIHTGKIEGINNKLKVIKRKAYGFVDMEYFILKAKYATLNCN